MTVRTLRVLSLTMGLIAAQGWCGGVDWKDAQAGNTGTFADEKGSKASFAVVEGAMKDEKALQMTFHQIGGGYAGVWHDVEGAFVNPVTLKFMAKADPPGALRLTVVDANKVQYVTRVPVSKDWAEVVVPVASLEQNPDFQPEGVDTNKPLDLSRLLGVGFAPGGPGDATYTVGPWTVVVDDPAAKKKALEDKRKSLPKGLVMFQDFAEADEGLGGVWKDDKGTVIERTFKAAPKKDNAADRVCTLKYNLVDGGWCGMWYRAGTNWDGVDCTAAKALVVKVYSDAPILFGISLEDLNKLKMDLVAPVPTTGGRWETVTLPMDAAPDGFGVVKTFNIFMKTPGDHLLSIDTIQVER